jgi:hypothetical protein
MIPKLSRIKRTAFFLISLIILSDLSTIQFRLAFKDKGHKSLEYCCLVIHLIACYTFNIRKYYTITLWFPCLDGLIQTRGNVARVKKGARTRAEGEWFCALFLTRATFHTGFDQSEHVLYTCYFIKFLTLNPSNGGILILIAPLGITNTRTNVLRVICQQYDFAWFSKAINR